MILNLSLIERWDLFPSLKTGVPESAKKKKKSGSQYPSFPGSLVVGLQPLSLKETNYSGDNSWGNSSISPSFQEVTDSRLQYQADYKNVTPPVKGNREWWGLRLKSTASPKGIQFHVCLLILNTVLSKPKTQVGLIWVYWVTP